MATACRLVVTAHMQKKKLVAINFRIRSVCSLRVLWVRSTRDNFKYMYNLATINYTIPQTEINDN